MGVAFACNCVRHAMGSDTSGTLDLERLDIGSCGSERVLMATLGVGCGVIVLKSPHVTFCTLGDGCESWCDGAIGRTGVAGRGEASNGCTCPCNCRECRTFAGDIVLGAGTAGPTRSCTGLFACHREQMSRKLLITFNCASQRAVGTSTNAPVSNCRPCSMRSAGVILGRVSWSWRYSTVSEIVIANVCQGITLSHQ